MTHMRSLEPEERSAALDGSRLCLACGLCCQGILHEFVRVDPDEVAAVEARGFVVQIGEKGPVFPLPCSHHRQGCCSIYGDRPRTCGTYQCRLLRRYLGGEAPLDRALTLVAQVQELRDSVYRRIGGPREGATLWQRVAAHQEADAGELDPELSLDVASLLALSRRHFDSLEEPRRVTP